MQLKSKRHRNRHSMTLTVTVGLLCMLFGIAAISEDAVKASEHGARTSEGIGNLLIGGEVDLSFRYRYEYVDQDGISDEAKASTMRSRLSLQSGTYRNFDFFVEVDDVQEVGVDQFNSGAGNTPDRTQYPVVADPEGTEVNQIYIDYAASKGWTWRLGRQRINLDNQRFVGGVGWRQNEQTFDALSTVYQRGKVTVRYAYVWKVRRIFGEDVPAGLHDQNGTQLLNVSGEMDRLGKITGYYYRIDNGDSLAASTKTIGFRLSGRKDVYGFKTRYTGEYATQTGIAHNPVRFDADYWNLEAGVIIGDFDIGLGWEVLTGDANDSGKAFRTPLATLHVFNGWADKFLTTPAAGLDDRYLKFKVVRGNAIVQLRLHNFEAEDGGSNFGDELDLRIGYKMNDKLRGDLFFASYNGRSGIADTDKFWLMFSMKL